MANSDPVRHATAQARSWGDDLGLPWRASLDQLHAQVRSWAEEIGVDPSSYPFQGAWCVAATFLHRMARVMEDSHEPEEAETVGRLADILATVGLWGGALIPDPPVRG
jgi:hypothetical protein